MGCLFRYSRLVLRLPILLRNLSDLKVSARLLGISVSQQFESGARGDLVQYRGPSRRCSLRTGSQLCIHASPFDNPSYRLTTGKAGQKCSGGVTQLAEWAPPDNLGVTCRSTGGRRFSHAYSRLYQPEHTSDSRMKFSLLTNVKNDPASPWDAVAVIGHVAARIKRTIMHRILGDNMCKPFGRNVAEEVVRFSLRLIRL